MKERALRVLMTSDAVGGVWVFTSSLAIELCRRGLEVTLVCLGPKPGADKLPQVQNAPGLALRVTDLALEWMDPSGQDEARAERVLAELEGEAVPDVVHLNSFREAKFAWRAPVLVTAHSCVQSWALACRGRELEDADWRVYAANVRQGLSGAQLWTAPTRWYLDRVEELYRPPSRGAVIRNGIGELKPCGEQAPNIMAAGRFWDEAKNLKALLAAQAEIQWPISVAGPVPEGMNGSGGIDWLGEIARTELLGRLGRSEIFVSPALYEPFGLTVLEAAASGCALVLSDIGSFRELWQGAALFVDARDGGALARAINGLIADEPMRRELQQKGRQRAGNYTLTAMADAYCNAYRRLADKQNSLGYRATAVGIAS